MSALAIVDFDYAHLDAETREDVQQRTAAIRTRMQRTAQDIIDIGRDLLEVKARLPHGQFGAWLQAEFGLSERSARRFMRAAQLYGGKSDTVADLPAKTIYALSEGKNTLPCEPEQIEPVSKGSTPPETMKQETRKAPNQAAMPPPAAEDDIAPDPVSEDGWRAAVKWTYGELRRVQTQRDNLKDWCAYFIGLANESALREQAYETQLREAGIEPVDPIAEPMERIGEVDDQHGRPPPLADRTGIVHTDMPEIPAFLRRTKESAA